MILEVAFKGNGESCLYSLIGGGTYEHDLLKADTPEDLYHDLMNIIKEYEPNKIKLLSDTDYNFNNYLKNKDVFVDTITHRAYYIH